MAMKFLRATHEVEFHEDAKTKHNLYVNIYESFYTYLMQICNFWVMDFRNFHFCVHMDITYVYISSTSCRINFSCTETKYV